MNMAENGVRFVIRSNMREKREKKFLSYEVKLKNLFDFIVFVNSF